MLYRDIYEDAFLDKFGKHKEEISNLVLDNSLKIDIEAITVICQISLNYGEGNPKGEKHEIIINKFEPAYKQRFTIAHELGHIILGHKEISYKLLNICQYQDTIERMNELSANKFAVELTMPKILVKEALINAMDKLDYSADQRFDKDDIKQLVNIAADKMSVSTQALNYRIKDLGLFVDEH